MSDINQQQQLRRQGVGAPIEASESNSVFATRYEQQKQKKAAREAESTQARRKRAFKKVSYWILGVLVVLGGGWLLVGATGPKGQDYSQGISILGRNHIANGTTASYNSNPPTSGDHYAAAAPAGFYDKELPDEQLVHNLEHGHVWISYKLSLSGEIIGILKDFSGGNVVVAPRSKNDTDIALAAWGRLDKFNIEGGGVDEQRIRDFISRYQNRGPENVNIPRVHGR